MKYAVSDIHSQNDELVRLLEKIRFDPEEDYLYILGDLFDRGRQPVETWHTYLELKKQHCCGAVPGNHDIWFIQHIHNMKNGLLRPYYYETIDIMEKQLSLDQMAGIADEMCTWPLQIRTEAGGNRYLLAHAKTAEPSSKQDISYYTFEYFRYNDPDYEKNGISGYISVVGHDITDNGRVWINEAGNLYMIDCGCYRTGRLGCLCLDTKEILYTE